MCIVEGCRRFLYARGYCKTHYKRWRKYRDPLGKAAPKAPPTPEELLARFYSHTQQVGSCLLWIGAHNNSGYGTLVVSRQSWVAHRWIFEQKRGPLPPNVPLIQSCGHLDCVELTHLSPRIEKVNRTWTNENITLLQETYAGGRQSPVSLKYLAQQVQRGKANVCRKARELGLTNQRRHKIEGGAQPKPRKYATDEELRQAVSLRMRTFFATHGHPRGALGMKHTLEAKAKMVAAIKRAWRNPQSGFHTESFIQLRSDQMQARQLAGELHQGYSRTRSGIRADIGFYVRSSWEANYARFLSWLKDRGEIKDWQYESYTFVFDAIKRGTRSYTPDFKVINLNGQHEWHEVKGWMDPKSKTRLERMAQYFPQEKVIVIDKYWFRQAYRSGLVGLIPNWEVQR
jgi:hypothetical protein